MVPYYPHKLHLMHAGKKCTWLVNAEQGLYNARVDMSRLVFCFRRVNKPCFQPLVAQSYTN